MFTRMDQSTKEEWDHIYNEHLPHVFDMPKRIISMLEQLEGYPLDLVLINFIMPCKLQPWHEELMHQMR